MNTQTHRTGVRSGIILQWLDMLDEHHVKFMGLDPIHDKKLIEQLHSHSNWIVEYANEEEIFFVREGTGRLR